uniref:inositol-polyphosphate 5-phosphatase n=1 Tax=Anopheles farauti TaxID=69004 RepID=A0A182QUI2_9DIPT
MDTDSLPILLVTANVGSVFEDALGNLYFVQRTVNHVLMWNFLTHEWETVEGKSIHSGSIETVATKEKAKFPQQFFPECKWSRKGFLRTRWFVNGTVFDLVNIHLFHDASNLEACEEYPSVYCKSRRRALVHTLERFHKDTVNRPVPYFVFGDFNFRCDTEGVIKKLTEDLTMHRVQNTKNDSTKVQYRDATGTNVLTVGKKEFFHCDQSTFKEIWLRQFDRELESLRSILYEYPISFPPSYPYEEDPFQPGAYMATRCPAWCDRILISPAARKLICEANESVGDGADGAEPVSYGIIGANVCMGDHKLASTAVATVCSNGSTLVPFADCPQQAAFHQLHYPAACARCAARIEQCYEQNLIDLEPPVQIDQQQQHQHQQQQQQEQQQIVGQAVPLELHSKHPLVSISVFDTDSNLNVCMCALYCGGSAATETQRNPTPTDSTAQAGELAVEACGDTATPPICPNCRNIIKHQSIEHRKTLISRRMMLANDVIVNRIDTHYLNTYSAGANGGGASAFEPYTPESAESHSPLPESCDGSSNSSASIKVSQSHAKLTDEREPLVADKCSPMVPLSALSANHSAPVATAAAAAATKTAAAPTGAAHEAASSGGGGGVSPKQLKFRLEKLKRLADERRRQYGEWTRAFTQSDPSKRGAGGTVGDPSHTVPLSDPAATSTASTSSNSFNNQCLNEQQQQPTAAVNASSITIRRESVFVNCCRGMCTIL